MSTKKQPSRLGRGLSSLIAAGTKKSAPTPAASVKKGGKGESKPAVKMNKKVEEPKEEMDSPFGEINSTLIDPNPYQPRMEMDAERVKELAASIKSEGLLQPLVVRKKGGRYELIAGERRWRACQSLKMEKIPVRIVKADDSASAVMALIENLQREDISPIDEAMAYSSLINDFELTQDGISQRIGRSRSSIANALRLLQLEQEIQGYVTRGLLSVGHAKVLLGIDSPEKRVFLARKTLEAGLTVRQLEALVQNSKESEAARGLPQPRTVQSAVIQDLQRQMGSFLSARVSLKHSSKKGKITIEYRGNEDLHRILEKIGFMGTRTSNVA